MKKEIFARSWWKHWIVALVSGAMLAVTAAAQNSPEQAAKLAPILLRQAGALEKAGRYEQAAAAYEKAAQAFETAGNFAEQATAMEKSAGMYEKMAGQPPQPAANVAAHPPAVVAPVAQTEVALPPTPVPTAAVTAPFVSLDASAIVSHGKRGGPAVRDGQGRPIDGVKLSRHDSDIYSPSVAVAADGTIHVAFVERQQQSPFEYFVYHRSSTNGGKTWSEAKNLSEAMPGYKVGNCAVAADGHGRVYVVWHTGVAEGYYTDMDSHADPHNNLVYRVLDHGAWSGKVIPVHPLFTKEQESDAGASWFLSVDPTGRVHVVWNMRPESRHPEALIHFTSSTSKSPAVGCSMVMEATLDGATPEVPREIFSAKIAEDPAYHAPGSDHLDTLQGYADPTGEEHFLAHVSYAGVGPSETSHRIFLYEKGEGKPVLSLPKVSSSIWRYPPRLLLDARGRQHIIAMYESGEQPSFRDYVVGSDAEPTTIRAAREVSGKIIGFQGFQGPGGQMIVVLEMDDTADDADTELYLTTSNGGAWSPAVNVTNNTGRRGGTSVATFGGNGSVTTSTSWYPGAAAAACDREGHLVLCYISKKYTAVASNAGAWQVAGSSSMTPNLLFLRF